MAKKYTTKKAMEPMTNDSMIKKAKMSMTKEPKAK